MERRRYGGSDIIMDKIINLQDYKEEKAKDIEELKKIINSYKFYNKDLEQQCNYYLEKYLEKIKG